VTKRSLLFPTEIAERAFDRHPDLGAIGRFHQRAPELVSSAHPRSGRDCMLQPRDERRAALHHVVI
jgi:hypothetical protein